MENDNLDGIKKVVYYLASRNSTGIHDVWLAIRQDGRIPYGYLGRFIPLGYVEEIGTGADWRTAHLFATREGAVKDYIKLEQGRVREAKAAIKREAA